MSIARIRFGFRMRQTTAVFRLNVVSTQPSVQTVPSSHCLEIIQPEPEAKHSRLSSFYF